VILYFKTASAQGRSPLENGGGAGCAEKGRSNFRKRNMADLVWENFFAKTAGGSPGKSGGGNEEWLRESRTGSADLPRGAMKERKIPSEPGAQDRLLALGPKASGKKKFPNIHPLLKRKSILKIAGAKNENRRLIVSSRRIQSEMERYWGSGLGKRSSRGIVLNSIKSVNPEGTLEKRGRHARRGKEVLCAAEGGKFRELGALGQAPGRKKIVQKMPRKPRAAGLRGGKREFRKLHTTGRKTPERCLESDETGFTKKTGCT